MPLEISEIGVRLAVGGEEPSDGNPPPQSESAAQGLTAAQRQALVEACTQQVLRSLRQAEER